MDPVNTSLEDVLEQTLHQNGVHQQQLFNSEQDTFDFNVDSVVTQIKQTVLSNGKIEGNNVYVFKVRHSPDTDLLHRFIFCYLNASCILNLLL